MAGCTPDPFRQGPVHEPSRLFSFVERFAATSFRDGFKTGHLRLADDWTRRDANSGAIRHQHRRRLER